MKVVKVIGWLRCMAMGLALGGASLGLSAATTAPGVSGAPAAAAQTAAFIAKPANCTNPSDALAQVKCSGKLRVGVRNNYPPFAYREDDELRGFEIDLARRLAAALGVAAELTVVTPANRMAQLGEGRVDVVIATMGHTLQRDSQALFVRPHYHQSQTVVLGRRALSVESMQDLRGKTVCVTVGNSTNAELSANGARLMLFDNAPRLVDELRLGGCSLVAQDDSFFASYFRQADFAQAYEAKFSFADLPWGAAVARDTGASLASALSTTLRQMHASGSLEALAQTHRVQSPFQAAQRTLWARPDCAQAPSPSSSPCALPPRDNQLAPTAFVQTVDKLEKSIKQATGIQVTLAMLKSEVALNLFLQGIGFSLTLVAGAIAATFCFALVLGAALSARSAALRWPARLLLWTMQSTPLILLMILASVLLSALGANSPWAALAAAVVVIGTINGSNAGQAIAENMSVLRAEQPQRTVPLRWAVGHARAQILAFIVNATRASPAASIIGVPELLTALTDIASFSSERITTYTLMLVFYMLVVATVVWLGNRWQAYMERMELKETAPRRGTLEHADA